MMADDSIIVLSDDCSDDCNFVQKNKLDKSDDYSAIRDKVDSDLSESEFPIVRFSEINYKPSSKKDSESEDLNGSHLSEFDCEDKNDSSKKNSKENRLNESHIFEKNSEKVRSLSKNSSKDSYDGLQNMITDSFQETEWSNYDLPEVNVESNFFVKNTNGRNKSDSDSDYESQCVPKKVIRKKAVDIELSDDDEKSDDSEKVVKKTVRKKRNKAATGNDKDSCPKPTKKRGPKAASKTNPKDYMKMMDVILDNEIAQYDFFGDFSNTAHENEIKFRIESQIIPKSISWTRKVEEIDDEQELDSNVKVVDENQLLIIWDCEETVKHVSEGTFTSAISSIQSLMSNKKISLVIYKIQNYFKYLKSARGQAAQKNSDNNKPKKSRAKTDNNYSNYPRISKKQFDECLVEIQLLYNANSRLIENPADMILLIQQYTKSLANLPSKMEKDEKLSEIDWCISVDNKDSVKIDKEGNGLIRLWQQQLCQFAQTSLETSEAIATVYKSPLQLMEAYSKCTRAEGELLLKDIPIRRNAGILTSSKKIGPELSKKVYIMFTSEDGDIYLNES